LDLKERKERGDGVEDKKRWCDSLADFFELPKEVVLNLARISMIGNFQFHLENHRGVIEYTEETVRIGVNNGEVIIRGRDLRIKSLLADEILVEGRIEFIGFES
jgi:sporulation protein YqfC